MLTSRSTTAPAVPLLVRWAFYGFVFSLPFEYPARSIPLEINTLAAALFLATTVFGLRACYGRWPLALWFFLAYAYSFLVAFVVNDGGYPDEVQRLFLLLVQALLVFWAASNLMRSDDLARRALLTLAVACLGWAVLQLGGVGRSASFVETGGARLSALGQNPNNSARILMIGLLGLIGLANVRARPLLRGRMLIWPVVGVLGIAIIQTGSRGALVALAAGLLTFAFGVNPVRLRVRTSLAALLALGLLAWGTYRSDVMRNRLQQTAVTGRMAGRERLYPALWQMFVAKPVLGWGPIANKYELGAQPGQHRERRDAHNVILEVLTATGLVGGSLFLLGLAACVLAAWRARLGPRGLLPFALLIAVLVGSMSMNWIAALPFWLVLGYAIASAPSRALAPRRAPPSALGAWRGARPSGVRP